MSPAKIYIEESQEGINPFGLENILIGSKNLIVAILSTAAYLKCADIEVLVNQDGSLRDDPTTGYKTPTNDQVKRLYSAIDLAFEFAKANENNPLGAFGFDKDQLAVLINYFEQMIKQQKTCFRSKNIPYQDGGIQPNFADTPSTHIYRSNTNNIHEYSYLTPDDSSILTTIERSAFSRHIYRAKTYEFISTQRKVKVSERYIDLTKNRVATELAHCAYLFETRDLKFSLERAFSSETDNAAKVKRQFHRNPRESKKGKLVYQAEQDRHIIKVEIQTTPRSISPNYPVTTSIIMRNSDTPASMFFKTAHITEKGGLAHALIEDWLLGRKEIDHIEAHYL